MWISHLQNPAVPAIELLDTTGITKIQLTLDSSAGVGPYVMDVSVFDFENFYSVLEKTVKQELNVDSTGCLI